MMKLGTDGFRGVIGVDFTKENVCKIIQCACDIIKKKKFKNEVVVGCDNRFMSEHYAKWISEVLVANGIKVLLTDSSVPTPLVSFATKYLHNQMGMMVTASHNPYTFNGVKFFTREGRGIEPDIEEAFNKMLNKTKKVKSVDFEAALSQGKIVLSNFTKEYVKKAHKEGIMVNPWTVNKEKEIKRMIFCGVDGIITDAPGLCNKLINS